MIQEPESTPQWLERTEMLMGRNALGRLRHATVVVAGLGGVGAYAAEMVARAGVGRMIIIDSDRVSVIQQEPSAAGHGFNFGQA